MAIEQDTEKTNVPIIIGNYLPFRLVLRESDNWDADIEQINSRDYDYVKLNRLSTFIDINIHPFSLGIGFDGSLVLPAIDKYQNRFSAQEKFNETLSILLLGGVYSESIQPEDISHGTLTTNGYYQIRGETIGPISHFHRAIRTKHVGALDVIRLYKPQSINIDDIEIAYSKGSRLLNNIKGFSPILLLEGTSYFVRNKLSDCMIFLWTVIEQALNIIWSKELIEKRLDKDIVGRKSFLKDYRSWTSSTKLELLFQKNKINIELYRSLDSARKARNNFIHNGKNIGEEVTKNALEGSFKLISLITSNYKSSSQLNEVINTIYKYKRMDLYSLREKEEPKFWLNVPPIPGDSNWGDKEYEIIDDLVLKPISTEK